MPVEPHTQMHTGVEQHGTFGALPDTSIAGTEYKGWVCVHAPVPVIDQYTTKMKMASMQETDERKKRVEIKETS